MSVPRLNDGCLRLSDGGAIGWSEYGDAGGFPVFHFHGWPSSRLEASVLAAAADEVGVRLLAVDRPGVGLSDLRPGFGFLAWPAMVAELAAALRCDRFAVVGVSSGAPYALACAHLLGDRLAAVGVISGVSPLDGPDAHQAVLAAELRLITVARAMPWLARLVLERGLVKLRRDPQRVIESLARRLPPPDRDILATPTFRDSFLAAAEEAGRSGIEGLLVGLLLEGGPWGFEPEEIAVPCRLWHGERDSLCLPQGARRLAERLPAVEAVFYPEEGHLSTVLRRGREILAALLP